MRRAAVAGKALADKGLVHHAEHRRALVQQRDQRAPDRKARDEGFGAVDRIQHPDIFGVLALVAEFLADDAVLGKIGLDQPPHHRFGGAVGFGHRIEIVAGALVVDAERGPEERQDGFAGSGRKAADEGCKIDDRHGGSLDRAEERCPRSCLAQSGRWRTDNGRLGSVCTGYFRASNQPCEAVNFLMTTSITKSRACRIAGPAARYDRGWIFKYLILSNENVCCAACLPSSSYAEFCTGNDSKALALCAARSHIVAVR